MQPLFADFEFGGLAIGHNGNLTNALKLRRQLVKRGCLFQSTTDTEVIIHLIATSQGATVLDRLIDAPTDMPTCLCFGGRDLSTLFVTSIKDSGSGRAISRHPMGGHMFASEGLGVKGLAEPRLGEVQVGQTDG